MIRIAEADFVVAMRGAKALADADRKPTWLYFRPERAHVWWTTSHETIPGDAVVVIEV